jgi:hypothetical protein
MNQAQSALNATAWRLGRPPAGTRDGQRSASCRQPPAARRPDRLTREHRPAPRCWSSAPGGCGHSPRPVGFGHSLDVDVVQVAGDGYGPVPVGRDSQSGVEPAVGTDVKKAFVGQFEDSGAVHLGVGRMGLAQGRRCSHSSSRITCIKRGWSPGIRGPTGSCASPPARLMRLWRGSLAPSRRDPSGSRALRRTTA